MKKKTKEERDLDAYAYSAVTHALKFGVPEAPKVWKQARFKSYFDLKIKTKILEFRLQFLSNRSMDVDPVRFEVPADPFEHALEAWAPKWLLARRPVRYKTFGVVQPLQIRICPHHDMDWKHSKATHQRFIVGAR